MDIDRGLWDEFRKVWTPERVKAMTLQKYTSHGNKDTFTYWLEAKLGELGSIWGGSSFKFGIFSRNDKSSRENAGKRMYTEKYGWLQKYGSSEEEAFNNIKAEILEIIDAVQKNELERIRQVDLGSAYKWKIAFHYQNSLEKPVCINIFRRSVLEKASKCPPGTTRHEMYRKIITDWKGGNILQYGKELWEKYSKEIPEDPGDIIINEPDKNGTEKGDGKEINEHTEIQYLLLDLGSKIGLDVWVARNDKNKQFNGESFSAIKNFKTDLPVQFVDKANKIISNIDVLWLKKNNIVAAFEIESTTSIYSGLLRMSDLIATQPNINIPLFLVAPDERRSKVIAEVNRQTFSILEPPLCEICRFISFSKLKEELGKIKAIIRYIKPEWLQEISESCGPEEV